MQGRVFFHAAIVTGKDCRRINSLAWGFRVWYKRRKQDCRHRDGQRRLMSTTIPHATLPATGSATVPAAGPLTELEQWDDFIGGRYREGKSEAEFRVYDAAATPGV